MELRMLYVTFPDMDAARAISERILGERLIACYNLYEMQSGYWWKEDISRDSEVTSIMKTVESKVQEIETLIENIHPYDVPCIINLPFKANKSYSNWIIDSIRKEDLPF